MQHRPADEPKGRIIKLRPNRPLHAPPPSSARPPVEDLSRYEGSDGPDDDRHRMLTNLAAGGFTLLLMIAGLWIAITMADLRKNQDCVLSGRRNCAQILILGPQRN